MSHSSMCIQGWGKICWNHCSEWHIYVCHTYDIHDIHLYVIIVPNFCHFCHIDFDTNWPLNTYIDGVSVLNVQCVNCNTKNIEVFLIYHPTPWRDSISRPIAPQSEAIPLYRAAGAFRSFFLVRKKIRKVTPALKIYHLRYRLRRRKESRSSNSGWPDEFV
jgi:hypothetical protein